MFEIGTSLFESDIFGFKLLLITNINKWIVEILYDLIVLRFISKFIFFTTNQIKNSALKFYNRCNFQEYRQQYCQQYRQFHWSSRRYRFQAIVQYDRNSFDCIPYNDVYITYALCSARVTSSLQTERFEYNNRLKKYFPNRASQRNDSSIAQTETRYGFDKRGQSSNSIRHKRRLRI